MSTRGGGGVTQGFTQELSMLHSDDNCNNWLHGQVCKTSFWANPFPVIIHNNVFTFLHTYLFITYLLIYLFIYLFTYFSSIDF